MKKSIFASQTIWRTVLAGVVYLAPLTVLELGMVLVIPSMFNPIPAKASNGDLPKMLDALGYRESKNNYREENTLGFIGKYQFGEAVLIDLGYYKPRSCTWYGNGANSNTWNGTWARGIQNKDHFKQSPNVQEQAIREAFALNWHYLNHYLENDVNRYLRDRKVTLAGVLAGAHLVGTQAAVAFLTKGEVQKDPYGVPITEYIQQFGGYNITPADFGGGRQPQPSGC